MTPPTGAASESAPIGTHDPGSCVIVAILAAVDASIDRVDAAFGPVDVLVHNAGIPVDGFPLARFRELDAVHGDRWMDVNYHGMLHTTWRVLDGMCERGWGRIVFASSEAGRTGIGIGVACYGAAKAATMQFCRHHSQEVARNGVTVNCLALGRMSANIVGADRVKGAPPVGRMGSPSDVAAVVVYLASDEASFVTGQTLGINGGAVTSRAPPGCCRTIGSRDGGGTG